MKLGNKQSDQKSRKRLHRKYIGLKQAGKNVTVFNAPLRLRPRANLRNLVNWEKATSCCFYLVVQSPPHYCTPCMSLRTYIELKSLSPSSRIYRSRSEETLEIQLQTQGNKQNIATHATRHIRTCVERLKSSAAHVSLAPSRDSPRAAPPTLPSRPPPSPPASSRPPSPSSDGWGPRTAVITLMQSC